MSEGLHWEASSAGIRVHVIEPGRFPTTDFGSNIVRPDGWEGSTFEAKAPSLREALMSLDSGDPPTPRLWPMQLRSQQPTQRRPFAPWWGPTRT